MMSFQFFYAENKHSCTVVNKIKCSFILAGVIITELLEKKTITSYMPDTTIHVFFMSRTYKNKDIHLTCYSKWLYKSKKCKISKLRPESSVSFWVTWLSFVFVTYFIVFLTNKPSSFQGKFVDGFLSLPWCYLKKQHKAGLYNISVD